MKKCCCAIVLTLLLGGCALGPSKPESNPALPITEGSSGIVVGRMCRDNSIGPGISVRNLDTGQEYSYFGAVNFALRLPAGRYSFLSIGWPGGVVSSNDPFRFDVMAGSVRYIGTFLYPWGGRDCNRVVPRILTKYYQNAYRGLLGDLYPPRLNGPVSNVSVVDEPDIPIRDFRERYNQHANSTIETALAY